MTSSLKSPVPLGIGDLVASCGDHIAYFWESDDEFARAVKFLECGLQEGDSCVLFGHDEANERALQLLRFSKVPVDKLIESGQLAILGAGSSGDATLATISESFALSLARGAPRLRLLGNIGWGRESWPTENDILAFEARVTGTVAHLPCVVVCMYDVRSLPGRIILHGALETHPLTFCRNVIRHNPAYVPITEFLATHPKK